MLDTYFDPIFSESLHFTRIAQSVNERTLEEFHASLHKIGFISATRDLVVGESNMIYEFVWFSPIIG